MTDTTTSHDESSAVRGSAGEVFTTFLKLGFTSFGGPIAHLGYFRDELVSRRKWIDEQGYADLVALSQFLPGPASSQVGFALGLLRGGPLGALAAWAAFTLPSALLLVLFAYGAAAFGGPVGGGVITGLKIVAVAIVAQAVWGMARNLCPDRERATIALGAVLIIVLVAGALGQVAAIAAGAAAGLLFCRNHHKAITRHIEFPVSRTFGAVSLVLFFALLIGLPILAPAIPSQELAVFDSFYRAGSLVFGGGHVVLPLLETEVVKSGWVSHDQFLAGYGAAQAVPGPLFTFAAYLGTVLGPEPNGLIGASIALIAVFLPGFLILLGVIPFWDSFRKRDSAQALMRGANAAVVGILGAALYDPVFTSAIVGPYQFALALTCFVLLMTWKIVPWIVVLAAAAGGVLIGAL
ncbi:MULTISPECIES: chromate efflux transporter [Hyphomicrobiales]|uniref:Chromate transporter, chromate ion transporter (CHR) family n=1 Tax=Brucella anthropi (strain ATCC 49188 / DSM 6882 / CCUG 24695 / JCM 21032 / LMG 3331 / NBRC 15819 / NCTC 12168 / Alc 37) TaxID=439375 RepID=A6X805_BRUA4|nr:chromate efflux transporter [Brucella anthropi]ABS17359.1 chromate transporter, chromate ion transporter (CHR) family [Brucella anthropi ATCC 49188]ABS17434.1 chromate transporter, chromate ion transporter (CHR) family [Brucella anthropi ATCC 49188]AIK41109.1 chromate transporter, chromate ion transporter family protein [Brucella anthropi]KAB2727535.1 chromate efflux transporter [Brucella anthropi]KAB2744624.1 chromate efflux transporter [Brucella anthropi]